MAFGALRGHGSCRLHLTRRLTGLEFYLEGFRGFRVERGVCVNFQHVWALGSGLTGSGL